MNVNQQSIQFKFLNAPFIVLLTKKMKLEGILWVFLRIYYIRCID